MASKISSVSKVINRKTTSKTVSGKNKQPSVVSAYEAKTHFSALLERASKGESITITKHGQEVAKLSPIKTTRPMTEVIAELKAFGKGKTLGKGLTLRDLIEEGRRY
jgi:prevent-host-death family protein